MLDCYDYYLSRMLCFASLVWFLFDIVVQYPLQTAIIIISLYVVSYLWRFLPSHRRSDSSCTIDYADSSIRSSNSRLSNIRSENKSLPQKDFRALTSRIDGMERKTDILNDRLERLCLAFDRMNSSRTFSDDEHDDGNEAEIDE